MKKINVIFRACDKIPAVNKVPRPFCLDKPATLKLGFQSLYNAIKFYPHSIFVLGDDLSDETMQFFSGFPVQISNKLMGNDESIRQSIYHALSLPDDEIVYFCEDDYLHQEETFQRIHECLAFLDNLASTIPDKKNKSIFLNAYHNTLQESFIFPPDYPDRYTIESMEASFLINIADTHWRQVKNITFTFITSVKCIKKHQKLFLKSAIRARDGMLSRMLFRKKKLLCLSPIPGLSTHLHQGCMSPGVDWSKLATTFQKYA